MTYDGVGRVFEPDGPQRGVTKTLDAPFDRCLAALREWRQYDLGWCHVARPRPALVEGELSATIARAFGLWSVNCCRIVRVIEEPGRFAFAIGTLPHHVETGEELFELTDAGGGRTTFRIASFSGPHHPLVRIGWPVASLAVRRFLREAPGALERCASAV